MPDNKAIVERMFVSFERDWMEPELILRDMIDEGEWWIAGSTPISGWRSKAETIASLRQLQDLVSHGLRITPTGWTIDGDRVAVEAYSEMAFKDGRQYKNVYHFLIQFENEKMVKVKEYMDTDHLRETYVK